MRKLITALVLSIVASTSMAGILHVHSWGWVYDGDSPMSIGSIQTSSEGKLWVDEHGNLYIEGENFPFACIDYFGSPGYLYREWDDYYVQGNFFPLKAEVVESLKNILNLNAW